MPSSLCYRQESEAQTEGQSFAQLYSAKTSRAGPACRTRLVVPGSLRMNSETASASQVRLQRRNQSVSGGLLSNKRTSGRKFQGKGKRQHEPRLSTAVRRQGFLGTETGLESSRRGRQNITQSSNSLICKNSISKTCSTVTAYFCQGTQHSG